METTMGSKQMVAYLAVSFKDSTVCHFAETVGGAL